MNNPMPCGLEDDRVRFEPDEPEEESPLTEVEKRISWICDDWADALENDNYDEWRDLRMMLYGACQALIHCAHRYEDYKALNALGDMAFENSTDCIRRGKYEGATNEFRA